LNKPPAVAKASEDLRIEVKYQSNLEIAGFLLKFCKKHSQIILFYFNLTK